MKITHNANYAQLRAREYPSMEEFADAMWWNEQGHPERLRAWHATCAAIKAKYPKTPSVPDPMPVPQRVTRRQARRALLARGLLDEVESILGNIPETFEKRAMQIDWNDATDFERSDPTLIQLATQLGLSSEDLDNLFRLASSIAYE
jgi:hydroxyethylthiazole kinase-like sugar kinase family protein